MEIIKDLKATLQKNYYGKAKTITNGDVVQLKSYNTIVCEYNTKTKVFKKLWRGYSRTTSNHIKDFILLYNIDFDYNKKNWLKAENENENTTKFFVTISNGFYTHNTKNTLLFDKKSDAEQYAETIRQKNKRLFAFAECL